MNKLKQISIFLAVTLIATVLAGCVGYGDIGAVIGSWNKIVEKENQLTLEVEQIDFVNIDVQNPTKSKIILQQNTVKINNLQKRLDEESTLISEFSGSTVKVTGDANKYANEALINIRESQRYSEKQIPLLQELNNKMIELMDIQIQVQKLTELTKTEQDLTKLQNAVTEAEALTKKTETIQADIDRISKDTSGESQKIYYNKAFDAIKKLEALQ